MTIQAESIKGPIDLLITGCDIVTMDDAGTVLSDAAIAVSDTRIVWMGSHADASRLPSPSSYLDGHNRVALPGMIDAHVHTAQQLLRGKLAELSRKGPLRNPPWKNYYVPFEALLSPEDVHLSGLVAYTNMLRVGTTFFAEAGGPHPDEMGRAAKDVGIRGLIALSTTDQNTGVGGSAIPSGMMMTTDQAYSRNVELVKRWRNEKLVQASLSLRQIIVCSPELIAAMGEAARDLDVKIHTCLLYTSPSPRD